MSKRYESAYAVCPFYKSEDSQKIYCEGIGQGTAIHLAFAVAEKKREYEKAYCCGRFPRCRIAQMLERKWEESK